MIASVNVLSDGFNTIGKIYSDVKDGGAFDFSLSNSKNLKETFSSCDREYNAFIEKVSSFPDNIEGRRDAFSSLISKWIESKDIYIYYRKNSLHNETNMVQTYRLFFLYKILNGINRFYIKKSSTITARLFQNFINPLFYKTFRDIIPFFL